jgi:hypothetical protein
MKRFLAAIKRFLRPRKSRDFSRRIAEDFEAAKASLEAKKARRFP